MIPQKPSLWALLLIALGLVACGGGTLAVVVWWLWQAWSAGR